jgi:drug/metabolite transporter (DMT)-like permease
VSPTAITLILIAAVGHASWNLFSKQAASAGAVSFIWLTSAAATIGYIPVIAITVAVTRPHLSAAAWVFLAGTGVLQAGYFLFLQSGYRLGDLSLVYPIGRGTGALLAAVAGIAWLGERPGPVAIAGIAALVVGIAVIGVPARGSGGGGSGGGGSGGGGSDGGARPPARLAITFALLTGMFIAGYTLWDRHAVAVLHTPAVLQGYAAFPVMAVVFAAQAGRDRDRTARMWQEYRPQVLGAAVLMPLTYMLVLIALSFTAVAVVAPAREVSVLFGVLIGRRLLDEGSTARRLAAATAIVAGIVAIAVG